MLEKRQSLIKQNFIPLFYFDIGKGNGWLLVVETAANATAKAQDKAVASIVPKRVLKKRGYNMDHYIRYADKNDFKELGYIHSESFKTAYKTIIPDSILNNISAQKREKYFHKVLSENLEEDVLIFNGNNPVGFMTLGKCRDGDLDASWGEIWGIYLLSSYWNQGIGTELINFGEKELKKSSFEKISLWVLEENINARKSYEKLGFKRDGAVKKLNIGKELNEYRYMKNIT